MYYYIDTIIWLNSLDPKNKQMFGFGKMGKYRLLIMGRTKNQNMRSVFQATYKLVHLHTNFILKHLNKNPIKPSKIKHFTHFNPKIQYRTQYRQTQLKSTLSPISNHNLNPQSKPLSSYINTKIIRKIPTFTDLQTFH